MKKALWLPTLGVSFLLALGAASCVRPKPTPVAMVQATDAEAPKNLPTAIVIATSVPTMTLPSEVPTAVESTSGEPGAGEPTDAPAEVVVVVEDTPPAVAPAAAEPTPGSGGTQPPQSGSEVAYLVRWGDTLSRIAQQYGTTITAIVNRNPQITNRNFVKAGTTLVIPVGATTPVTGGTGTQVARETGVYMVQRGDTLATIARRFGTSVAALLQANPNITNRNAIWSGQRLIIPAGDWSATRTHVVRYGDTLSAIARRYNTTVWSIVVRNNLANANVIYPGQVLVIP